MADNVSPKPPVTSTKHVWLRRHLTSMALVLGAVCLGGYLWFVDRSSLSTDEAQSRKHAVFPAFQASEVVRLVMEQPGDRAALELSPGDDLHAAGFYMTRDRDSNERMFADQVAVESILRGVRELTSLRHVQGPVLAQDLERWGLSKPLATLTLETPRTTYRLAIGALATSPSQGRYVQAGDDKVFVVSAALAKPLHMPIDRLLPKQLLAYSLSNLTRITLKNDRGTVRFERAQTTPPSSSSSPSSPPTSSPTPLPSQPHLEPPPPWLVADAVGKPRANRRMFQRMIDALADARAQSFLPVERAKQILAAAPSTLTVALTDKGNNITELQLGGACPADNSSDGDTPKDTAIAHTASSDQTNEPNRLVVALRTRPVPLAACVAASVFDGLGLEPRAFVDTGVFDITLDALEELVIRSDGKVLDIARKGSDWHVRRPRNMTVNAQDLQPRLEALLALQGQLVDNPNLTKLGLRPEGTSAPETAEAAQITVVQAASGPVQAVSKSVEIGATLHTKDGEKLALRRSDDGMVLLVEASAKTLLSPGIDMVTGRALLDINPLHLQQIAFTSPAGTRLVIAREEAGFRLVEPTGLPVDNLLAADLFDAVVHQRIESWVADHDDGSHGLQSGSSMLRIRVQQNDKPRDRALRFGLSTGESPAQGTAAKWEDEPGVFLLPKQFFALFDTPPIDRNAVAVNSHEVASVRFELLQLPRTTTTVMRENERWRVHGEAGKWSQEGIEALMQAAALLRAEGVVHVGAAKPEEGMQTPLLRIAQSPSRATAGTKTVVLTVGRADVWNNTNIYYVRHSGIEATFAVAQGQLRPLFELLHAPR